MSHIAHAVAMIHFHVEQAPGSTYSRRANATGKERILTARARSTKRSRGGVVDRVGTVADGIAARKGRGRGRRER